jgi:glucan biosynthesis protein C
LSRSAKAITAARRHDLDWLRIIAILLLIPYHSSRVFDVWESFYVKNAQTSLSITVIRGFLDPWGMALLFVIAGASSWLALRGRSGVQYLRERLVRLIVPLLFGLVVIVPPQAYLAWLSQGHAGSYLQFCRQYWTTPSADPGNFFGLFTFGHLWFILFLFVFSLLALPLFLCLKRPSGSSVVSWLAAGCQRPGSLLLFVVPLWFTEALPGLGGINPFAYFLSFVAGFVLLADTGFQAALDRSWRWSLGAGAVALAAVMVVRLAAVPLVEYSWHSTLFDLLRYFATWTLVTGLLGFGHSHLDRPHHLLPTLNALAYPFYILHQTVIVSIGFYVVRWNIGIWPKFTVIAVAAFGITLGLCGLLQRWSVTRAVLGMKG